MTSNPTGLSRKQWLDLEGLRQRFLARDTSDDYWESEALLSLYHQTLAQRIGWKWAHVLDELDELKWQPTSDYLVDFGCGSGIASEVTLRRFSEKVTQVELRDRSPLATQFAKSNLSSMYPQIDFHAQANPNRPQFTLIVSHLISELGELELQTLTKLAESAHEVIWVESGDHESSRRLSSVRDHLSSHQIIAPCPFSDGHCGMLSPELERHWCHFFAKPPDEVFHSRFWSGFSNKLSIDLTSLPVSYLAASKDRVPPRMWERILGRPRMTKAEAKIQVCGPGGIRNERIQKRDNSQAFKLARKGKLPSRFPISNTTNPPSPTSHE